MTMPTEDDLRSLILELDAAPYKISALTGKRAGMAELTLVLPVETVKRFWAIGKALKEAEAPPPTQLPLTEAQP